MKTHPSIQNAPLAIACGLLLSSLPAAAQSAEGFDASGLSPAEAPEANAAPAPAAVTPAPAPATKAAEILPSRFAGDQLPAYVQSLSAAFSIRSRQTDPFGRYQDPDFKAPEPKILASAPTQRFKAEAPTPFVDMVSALAITLVNAEKQEFLIGDRTFKVGSVFPILLPSGKQVKVQVLAVTASRIAFKNLETGESASVQLNMMPSGMKRGTDGIDAPGLVPGGDNAPIEIQPNNPLSNNP